MYKIFSLITFSLVSQFALSQPEPELDKTPLPFTFEINYWVNIHHFLLLEANLQQTGSGGFLNDSLISEMTADEQHRLMVAVEYYKNNFVNDRPETNEYLKGFIAWIVKQNERSLTAIPGEYRAHCMTLIQASLTFRNWIWDEWKLNEEPSLMKLFYDLQHGAENIIGIQGILGIPDETNQSRVFGIMVSAQQDHIPLPYFDGQFFYQGMGGKTENWQLRLLQLYFSERLKTENNFISELKSANRNLSDSAINKYQSDFLTALIAQALELKMTDPDISKLLPAIEKLWKGKKSLSWTIEKTLQLN